MPPPESAGLKQCAVVWDITGYDGNGVQTVKATPRRIKVRWNDKQSQAMDPNGQTITVDASAVLKCNVAVGSIIWLGDYNSLVGTAGPQDQTPDGLMEVKSFDSTLSVDGRKFRTRTIGMMRWKGPLPTKTV